MASSDLDAAGLEKRVIRSAVDWRNQGLTLVNFLAGRFTYRDAAGWRERIADGEITVNGRKSTPEHVLESGESVEYTPQDIPEPPAELHYTVAAEEENFLIVDKPANLCIHPAGPFYRHTLWYLLTSRYGKVHFVNRLDRETGGLVAVAKNPQWAKKLAAASGVKEYVVAVYGNFTEPLRADGFLKPANSVVHKKREFVFDRPETPPFEAVSTEFFPLRSNGRISLMRAVLHTGRMHQIRATCLSLGFPVVGDKLYGPDEHLYLKQQTDSFTDADRKLLILPHQALHAVTLGFTLPDGERIYHSALPAAMEHLAD